MKDQVENINRTEIQKVIEALPKKEREALISHFVSIHKSSHSGPLPSPETLKGYESIVPGAANRLITMLEKQVAHRITVEEKVVNGNFAKIKRGQYMGLFLTIFMSGIALLMAFNGFVYIAGIILSVVVTGLATIFVLNREPKTSAKGGKVSR